MPSLPQRRTLAIALLFAAAIAGIVWRRAPLHLPWFAYKYGGSMLWAVALYWLLAVFFPRANTRTLTLLSAAVAALVEFSRLVHIFPLLDRFRLTLPGKLLLGRFFGWKNICAYFAAIALTAFVDDRWLSRRSLAAPDEDRAA
jgi:hypothetical protein